MGSSSSFARKLALGFTALGLSVLAVALVAVLSLVATVRTKDTVAVRHAEQLVGVLELRYLVEQKMANGGAALLTGGRSFERRVAPQRARMLEQIAALRARLGAQAQPLLEHIIAIEAQYHAVLSALAAEERAAATYAARFEAEAAPRAEALRIALDRLLAHTDVQHEAAEAEARDINRRATVLIVAAAALGLFAAAWLARTMTRRLAYLVHRQRQAWEELQLIVDTLPVSVAHIDLQRRYRFVNRAFEEQVGRPREALVGHPAGEVVPAAMLAPFEPAMARALAGERVDVELRSPAPDGAPRELEVTFVPRLDADGAVEGVVSLVADVTAERQARERERFLARATELLTSTLDLEENLDRVVALAVPLLGDFCSAHVKLEGKSERHAAPEAAPAGGDPAARVVETGSAELGATSLGLPLIARGEVLGALGLVRIAGSYTPADVNTAEELARRMALAVENVRLYRETQRALAAREELLAVVSHDLRNPLGVVLIKAGQLETSLPEGPARRHVESLARAADRIDFLIRTLMDAASIERGKLRLDRARHDPSALATEAAELVEGLATERSIRLVVDAPAELPAVWADRERVLQVFENLLGNAIKFTPSGGTVTLRVRGADDATVELAVIDSGPGIPAAELPRVFERGFQGERKRRKGLGLGLYIARGIVLAHGGHLAVDSTPGSGATFTFTLPLFDAAWMSEAAVSPDIR